MEDIDYLWESTKAGLRGFESGRSGTVAIDGKEFNALKRIGELELTSAKTTVSSLIKLSKLKYDEANIEIWLSRLHHAYTADEFEMLAESTEYDEETDDDKTAEDDDYRYEEEDNEVEDDAYYYEDDEVEVVPPESDFSELQGDSHVEEIERENRAKLLQNRARATSIRYEANIKEYRQFCSAPPGSILNGVKLPDSKRIEDDLVTTAKVIFFLQQYFTLRPHLRAPRVGESMKYSSIKSAISALKDLQSEQCLNGTPEQINALKNVPKLCENPTDLDKILRHARTIHRAKKLAAAQDNAESTEEDIALTRDQIQQLAEFGVKIGAPRHPKNWLLSGNRFHLVHTIHRATGERGDTVRKASLNDFTLRWIPHDEGPMKCPVILFANNKDKKRGDIDKHYSCAIRHRQDPLHCMFFALAYHIFLTFILERVIPYPDVMPRPGEDNPESDSASHESSIVGSTSGEVMQSKAVAEYTIRPWFNEKLFYGYEKSERVRFDMPNPRKMISRQTLVSEHKYVHSRIHQALRPRHVLHFYRERSSDKRVANAASSQQLDLVGCFRDGGLDVNSLSNSQAFEAVRQRAGFSPRKGGFEVDRMTTAVDARFADKIFEPIYARLEAYILERDSSGDETRKKEVHQSDRELVILLKYLGVVLVQDLAFLVNRGDFVGHPILGHEFFRDDAYGFQAFRKKQKDDIKEAQGTPEERIAKIRGILEAAGEEEFAESIQHMFHFFSSRIFGYPGSVASQQHTPHDQPDDGATVERRRDTSAAGDVQSHSGTCSNTSPNGVTRAETLTIPIPRPVIASDVATWPKPPESNELPDFVQFIQFGNDVKSVQDVADEYYRKFGESAGIREVERFYGPKVRTGSKAKGFSYRAAMNYPNGSQRFARRNLIYRILEERGEADGVRELQARIHQKFPGEAPHWLHIKWLMDELNRDNAKRDPTRSDRVRASKAAKRRRLADVALGSPIASVDAPNDASDDASNGG